MPIKKFISVFVFLAFHNREETKYPKNNISVEHKKSYLSKSHITEIDRHLENVPNCVKK
jgi:hypothetical protein